MRLGQSEAAAATLTLARPFASGYYRGIVGGSELRIAIVDNRMHLVPLGVASHTANYS